jgi:O-antigen/teichoic acid export membrane protein
MSQDRNVQRISGVVALDDGRARHPVIGAVLLATQFLGLNVLGLFSTAYLIRWLGALQYGEWATAAALAAAHVILTSAGLRPMFVRRVARQPEHAEELLAEQLGLRVVLGALAAASAMTICLLLRYPPVVIACMAVGCIWIILSAISSTLGDLLQALEKFGSYSVTGLVSGLAVTAASVVVVYQGYGPIMLSVAYLIAPAINVSLYWRIASKYVRVSIRWDSNRAGALLREARLVGVSQIAAAARERAEQLLVPTLAGLEAFGIFSAGTMVADRLGNVPDAICTAFYPRISRAAHDASGGSLQRTVANMLTIAVAASVPVAIVGSYLAQPISDILLPGSSSTCRIVIQITVWAVPVVAMSLGMSFSLQAAGHHETVAGLGLRATGIGAVLSVGLIAALGITGASWSLLARPAILVVVLLPSFRRIFPAVLPRLPFGRIVLSSCTLAIVCLLTNGHRIGPALAFAALGVGTYGLALLASRVVPIPALVRLLTPVAATTHMLAGR